MTEDSAWRAAADGSIVKPLIEKLAEKIREDLSEIAHFSIFPAKEQMICAWLHPLTGIEIALLSHQEFSQLCREALGESVDRELVSPEAVKNAMDQVQMMDDLGVEVDEYPKMSEYLREAYPGFLEFPPDDMKTVLQEALDYIRNN